MWETTYFERNSRQSSTFSINRALLVLSPCFFFFLSFEPNLLRPSHETHLLAFPTLCLAFQQINLTPLQPIRSTQSADIFDSLPRPFSLYFSKSLTIRLQVNRVVACSNTPIMSIRSDRVDPLPFSTLCKNLAIRTSESGGWAPFHNPTQIVCIRQPSCFNTHSDFLQNFEICSISLWFWRRLLSTIQCPLVNVISHIPWNCPANFQERNLS